VKVVSAGHACGNAADFYVDEAQIPIMIGPAARRGLNVCVIDPEAGRVLSARAYDIWGNALDENRRLASDLNNLPEEHIVMIALKDSGMENLDSSTIAALRRVGATIEGRLRERESYALIGSKEGGAIAERRSERMILLETVLPFAMQQRVSAPRVQPPAQPRPQVPPTPNVVQPSSREGPSFPTAGEAVRAGRRGSDPKEAAAVVEKLQERIRAKRLAGLGGSPLPKP